MRQAYYSSTIGSFLNTNSKEIIGQLNLGNTQYVNQWTVATTSWSEFIYSLKQSFEKLIQTNPTVGSWHILLEYEIPRLASRIDAVVIAYDIIFVIEYKLDRDKFQLADQRQAEDYALDLKDFHLESNNRLIVPLILAPKAKTEVQEPKLSNDAYVASCLKVNAENFAEIIYNTYNKFHRDSNSRIDAERWEQSKYQPTPTIVQAAKALFAGQKVENITKYGAENLENTSKEIIKIINHARQNSKKVVCFITGVPGAGKTLVGLDIVHEKEKFGDFNTAYFSGNGPLINVLREALARDHYSRNKALYDSGERDTRPKRSDSDQEIITKVQNLHLFIKDGIRSEDAPTERIVVFDEAQRCWNAKHFSNKAKQNRNREEKPFKIEEKSEAELLFEFMSRHKGWAVIVALVGGGQEINTGEGGIVEWGKAIESKYSNWEVYISPKLLSGDSSTADQKIFTSIPENVKIVSNTYLHLNTSQRSFKANNLNSWVNAVIDNQPNQASEIAKDIFPLYPLYITRNIETAKVWLRQKRIGTKRIGLIASSGGLRLKPYAINVREVIDEAIWFLNDEEDVRSSQYLEIVATEYKVQGLELDWTGICWDADLRRRNDRWNYNSFTGTKWHQVNSIAEQQFLLNTYRVLLTRAREGIIIFVPPGDAMDNTRLQQDYDYIYDYLKDCGLVSIYNVL
jgi:DUF2075 family protein